MRDPYQHQVKISHNSREKKRELIISELASENAKILAFKLEKLAIARSHKRSRKLIHPRGFMGLAWLQLDVQSVLSLPSV